MSQWTTLKERVAGKWQLPLLAASFALLASALFHLKGPASRRPFPEAVQFLELLVRGEAFDRAIDLGDALLRREETTDRELAPVRLAMARSRSQKARKVRVDRSAFGRLIVEDYRAAAAHGETLTPDDLHRRAQAYEWQGRFGQAVKEYGEALAEGVAHPLELRRHVISLTLDHLDPTPEAADALLKRYLGDIGDARLDLRLWAVDRQLALLMDRGELDAVATLLAGNHDRFAGSDLFPRFEFMEALLLYHQGHFDQAEAQLRGIRNRVDRNDRVYAMTGWLLGRTVMSDGGPQRPQEAISFFTDVLAFHAGDPYALASRVGEAEALAMLERHEEALEAYRVALEDLKAQGSSRVVNPDVLRASLSVMAEAQRQAAHFAEAVEYAKLAVSLLNPADVEPSVVLLQQLAQLQTLLAGQLDQETGPLSTESRRPVEARSQAARDALADAAATYVRITQLDALNERRAAEASWWAAELYAKAGQRDQAATLFRAFVAERPQHAFVPRALLRIGQLLHMNGRLPEAIAAYQGCYQRFPRTLDGARALIPLAQAYLSLGPQYEEMAEKTLAIVLDQSEVFTPQAPEFADAVFLLGEAQNRHGQFERAIATFEEALGRYADDPRAWRARYQLADSYRRSGLALKAEARDAPFAEEMERMRAESLRRLRAAQGFYRELIDAYELRDPSSLDRRDRVYLRHARLYEADCYFETQAYARAIKLYEEAAGLFKDTTSALAAYVQMINCHVFLGEPNEARAALARAKVLVDSMSDGAFTASPSPERREDWKRYLDWLGKSDLF